MQSSLFEHAERRHLGNGAWIDFRSRLAATTPTRCSKSCATTSRGGQSDGRCTTGCSMCRGWSAFTNLVDEPAPHPRLKQIRRRLNDAYAGELGEQFTTAGLCLYRDGNDSVAWHGDTIGRSSTEDTMVAIVSLGAARVFALQTARRRQVTAPAAPARRPVGDGRLVPAHLGTRDTEDDQAHRPADQHPVPPARRALTLHRRDGPRSRSRARSVLTCATGWSGTTNGFAVTITRKVPKLAV